MNKLVNFIVAAAGLVSINAWAQTPPIQPKTPDVKLPPPIVLPQPKEIAIGKQPLSAEEAVTIALQHQPLIGIANGNLLSARGRTQQARSNLLPNFIASGGYTNTNSIAGTTTNTNQTTTSVAVDQLLFDFGRTRDTVRQEQALERATLSTLSRTQQIVALDVRQSYYNLVQALDDITVSEANVTNRQRQLDQAQARLTAGFGAPSDLVQAKTSLANAVIALTTTRESALNAQVILAQNLGIDPRTPITPASTAEAAVQSENDIESLVTTAMNNRPDIRAAQEQVNAAKFAISAAKKGNLPRISASAGVGSRGSSDPFSSVNGTVSINVSWNFMDSGFTPGAVKVASGNELVARSNLIQVTQQALAEVSQAFVSLQSSLQRVESANIEVANAKEFVRIAEGRYSGGIGLFNDVTTAQTSLVSAQRDLIQAQEDVQRVRARLKTAIGLL